jgi:aminoglycoside phosphotransferase (APT) family kinase protein
MDSEDVPGIDLGRVSRFFAEHVPGADVPLRFELLSGGRSNLTYRVSGAGQSWVLRRPPLGHVLPTAHDMAREFRVLRGVAGTAVPAPVPVALCQDDSVNGSPFYVMEYRAGVILETEIPEGFVEREEERRKLSLSLIEALVELHAVDYVAVGLGDFGRPDGYLERQVRRWAQQWERSKTRDVPEVEKLIGILKRSIPTSPAATLVHGDYRLGNMALDPKAPARILAIFDWEMATLGDPLADLGYTLIYWGEVGDPDDVTGLGPYRSVTARPGFLTRAELVQEYARRSGREVETIDFYSMLALYKLAVISEGIYARYLQGKTVGEGFDQIVRRSSDLARSALEVQRV